MLTGIFKRRPYNEQGPSFLHMAVAFTTGMIVTAAVALVPAATGISIPRSAHDSVVPAPPSVPPPLKHSGPDASSPYEYRITELVYTPAKALALS